MKNFCHYYAPNLNFFYNNQHLVPARSFSFSTGGCSVPANFGPANLRSFSIKIPFTICVAKVFFIAPDFQHSFIVLSSYFFIPLPGRYLIRFA